VLREPRQGFCRVHGSLRRAPGCVGHGATVGRRPAPRDCSAARRWPSTPLRRGRRGGFVLGRNGRQGYEGATWRPA
jgi:hypothetical protein